MTQFDIVQKNRKAIIRELRRLPLKTVARKFGVHRPVIYFYMKLDEDMKLAQAEYRKKVTNSFN